MRRKSFKKVFSKATAIALSAAFVLCSVAPARAVANGTGESQTGNVETYDSIDGLSGETLYDTAGNRVYACGGEVFQTEENGAATYYWFGVDDLDGGSGFQNNTPGIHLYSSTDLYNWEYKGVMYNEADDIYAHPKMLYNGTEYVMWVTVSSRSGTGMSAGKIKVLSSPSITGPFTLVSEKEIDGFVNLYEEAQGTAYLISQNYRTGSGSIMKTKLSSDYKTTEGEAEVLNFSGGSLVNTEGGIFKQNGKYYIVNAGMTEYAVADSLSGTWTKHSLQMWDGTAKKDITSKNQTSDVFRVRTENSDLWVCVGDSVSGGESKVCYIWLPIKFFSDGTIALWEKSNWKLEEAEGVPPEEPGVPGNYQDIPGLSGRVLYDTAGNKIYACGGEVHEIEENGQKKWYWFGVDDLNPEKMNEHPGIHLYSSSDLYNWDYEGTMLNETGITYAHPKMLYNGEEYVIWVSYYMSSAAGGGTSGTTNGGIRVATSKSIKGPFTAAADPGIENSSGFTNLYEESEGNAWLIYYNYTPASGSGLYRVKLNSRYTGIEEGAQPISFGSTGLSNAEGGIFKRNGKYYMVNSGMSAYAVADSFEGSWEKKTLNMWDGEQFSDIQLPNQTSHVFHVNTQEADTYVCMGDSVGGVMPGTTPPPVCYIWLPIEFFEDGTIALKEARDWTIPGMEPQKPEETEKPEETKAPEETTAPVESGKPGETTAPAETEKPVQTMKPEVTPELGETAEPAQTMQPEVTLKPGETAKPVQTLKPVQTMKPEVTLKPGTTVKPVQTMKPEVTAKPGETAKPAQTMQPEVTLKPGTTAKPAQTMKPEVTLKPGETTKPVQTMQPEVTTKPEQTMQPEVTLKPEATKEPAETEKPSETKKPIETAKPSETGMPSETEKPEETKRPIEVKSVLVAAKKLALGVGEKVQLQAAVYPRNAADTKLTYTSSNAKVKVSRNGTITGKKLGSCKITIAASNGKKAVVKVTVKKKPGKITLNARNKTLKTGKKFKIKVRLPKGTASQTLTYVSNKRVIADVSPEGKVTAKKKGYAVITVKTYNGKKASLKIHVK